MINKLNKTTFKICILLLFFIITISRLEINIAFAKEEMNSPSYLAMQYINNIESDEDGQLVYSFKHYNLAESYLSKVTDAEVKNKLQFQLYSYAPRVFNEELIKTLKEFTTLYYRKDIGTYENIATNLIPKLENKVDKEYLLEELYNYGQIHVYSPEVIASINAVSRAWEDEAYIPKAEEIVVNELSYKNLWSMCYFQNQLNMIKAKLNNDKEKILIIGDSLSLGMGAVYDGKDPLTTLERVWWRNLDQDRFQFSFTAIGGMGVIQQGLMNNIASERAIDMVKYAEATTEVKKDYDKVIIALSTNDNWYLGSDYKLALRELVDYIKNNYKVKEFILLNFYAHENEMKEVAEETNSKFLDVDMSKISKFNTEIDDFHPSAEGYSQIAELLRDQIR
ncbi:SGNH/GDSL hydrolase family protein [Desnuesiella massiliensis]|uniref:SGNH/GDSL hydrolase family protein n=1 Tax=Desnuesiella massiliensis TaxID=1650662 RepID=UPI0006E1D117|nr:SGNH/GDSL hydrolase family protein [Desnuesiella massiliensis]